MRNLLAMVIVVAATPAIAQDLNSDQKDRLQRAAVAVMVAAECESRFGQSDKFVRAVAHAQGVFTELGVEQWRLDKIVNEARKQAADVEPRLEDFVRATCNDL